MNSSREPRQRRRLQEPSVPPSLPQPYSEDFIYPLPLGKVNLLVLTDVHSWISGHGNHAEESYWNADYGDVLSFYQHLKAYIQRSGFAMDLFLVMNGDFTDGTGLSTVPPIYLTPLLSQMPFDIVNLGNHELYHDETVAWIRQEFIPHWRGHYLTSNTVMAGSEPRSPKSTSTNNGATGEDTSIASMEPMGHRFTYLKGEHSTLLVFGFLFNFQGNGPSTIVQPVEEVVQEEWFLNALQPSLPLPYDAILVMAHMHVTDPLVEVIRVAIRAKVGPNVPIQFITGHTHIRSFATLDDRATSFEAGRFLDTVGFCSFPTMEPLHDSEDQSNKKKGGNNGLRRTITSSVNQTNPAQRPFSHVFLDTNRRYLNQVLQTTISGTPSANPNSTNVGTVEASHGDLSKTISRNRPSIARWDSSTITPAGRRMKNKIHAAQERLGLNEVIGCSNQRYFLTRPMHLPQSLWGLYMYDIVPKLLDTLPSSSSTSLSAPHTMGNQRILVQGTGALRYDIFDGTLVLDDIIAVCPFNDVIYHVASGLSGGEMLQVLNLTSSENVTSKTTTAPNEIILSGSRYLLPTWAVSTEYIEWDKKYDLMTTNFHVREITRRVEAVLGHSIQDPVPVKRPPGSTPSTWANHHSLMKEKNVNSQREADADGNAWTTTDLWKTFVQDEWPCSRTVHSTSSTAMAKLSTETKTKHAHLEESTASPNVISFTGSATPPFQPVGTNIVVKEEKPLTVAIFISLIIFGLYVYQRRKEHLQRSGYMPIGDPTTNLILSSNRTTSFSSISSPILRNGRI